MSETTSQASTSTENGIEKQNGMIKYKIVDDRARILKDLKKSIESDRREQFRLKFYEFFNEDFQESKKSENEEYSRNVYDMVLIMLSNIPDKKKQIGKELAQWFLEDFKSWMTEREIEKEMKKDQFNEYIRDKSLRSCVKEPMLSDSIRNIFGFSQVEILKKRREIIEKMFEDHQFKEVSELIIKHGILDEFSFDQLVLPLILCDKCQIVDELLKLSGRLQKDYLRFLDYFVGETDEYVDRFFDSYKERGMIKINLNRFHGKSLTTFIQRFFNGIVKQYHFDVEERRDAPRFEGFMKGKALKYYCRQRFEERVMSDEVYFEHAKNTLQQSSQEIISYYFSLLWDTGIEERRIEVIFWIRFLNFPKKFDRLCSGIREFFDKPIPRMNEKVDKLFIIRNGFTAEEITEQLFVFEKDQKYPITIVKNRNELEELCDTLDNIENRTFVGYDSEFKPGHLVDTNVSRMATIQLFFNEKAYLVDCVELENQEISNEMWTKFFKSLFDSKKLTVIGFDMKNDLECLFSVQSIRDEFKQEETQNFICVKRLVEILNEIDMNILKLSKKSCRLITIAEELLQFKMDKTEQNGNWQCRPLRKNQIVYAALDAVIVLLIFQKITELAKQSEPSLKMEKLIEESRNVVVVKKEKIRKELKSLNTMSWEEAYEILHTHRDPTKPLQKPSDLKIIVDTMVLGIGKNLRLLGIDVVIPRDANELKNYLQEMKTAKLENQRYVLTVPSKSYETLKEENPDAQFILLHNIYNKQWMDLITDFLDRFNLELQQQNEFVKS